MFKKFLLTFVLCMGIFGVTAFADTVPSVRPNDTEYSYTIMTCESGIYYMLYTDGGFKLDDDYVYANSGIHYKWNGTTWVQFDYSGGSVMRWGDNEEFVLIYSSSSEFSNYWYKLGNSSSGVTPPEIAPTAKQAIAKIVPDLLEQSKKLLPVGVILLSTMLGVLLVRRLVPLFL